MLVYPADHLPVNHVRLDTVTSASDTSSRSLSKVGLRDNSVKRRFNGRIIRKRVTFKKDLVSIREIPPRESHSDSSDNDALTDSSSGEDSDDSSSCESSDEDDGAGEGTMAEQISRLVLKHTRCKPARPVQEPRTIPPRPPRLRRPRLAPMHKKPEKVIQPKNQARASGDSSNENTRARTFTALPAAGLGRLTQIRRPQSCAAEQRERTRSASVSAPIARSCSAKPTLTLTSRSTDGMASVYGGFASGADKTDNSNTNSGQERTKFYAWQVANGAPLVTTPGISPLYAEQVTVTKLKH